MQEQICFLFGHRDAPDRILPALEGAIEEAVLRGVSSFYVGYHGGFDHLAAGALRRMKEKYPHIALYLLLAYHPAERPMETPWAFDGTFYPPLEGVPRRFAIVRANRYMIEHADQVICYVCHPGNTRNLLSCAQRRKKAIANLGQSPSQ